MFPCICPKYLIPVDDDNDKLWAYILILTMWLFGVLLIISCFFWYNIGVFRNKFWIYSVFFYFFAFQIPFTFLTTPFILICIIYPKFIGRYMYFFGIGEDLQNEEINPKK